MLNLNHEIHIETQFGVMSWRNIKLRGMCIFHNACPLKSKDDDCQVYFAILDSFISQPKCSY